MEQQMAIVRSWGVALTAERIPLAALSLSEEEPVRKESLCGKRKAGRATKRTPVNAMRPAKASFKVNGSYKGQSEWVGHLTVSIDGLRVEQPKQ